MSAGVRPDRAEPRATGGHLPGAARTGASPASAGLRATSALVALAGLGIAGYLTAVHYSGGTPLCAVSHGCETVQRSAYAELAGVPVALLGLAGYAALLASLARDSEATRTASAFLSLAGFGFSAWLTYVEVARLHAVCSWCVASAACMTVLAALSVARMLAGEPGGGRPALTRGSEPPRTCDARPRRA